MRKKWLAARVEGRGMARDAAPCGSLWMRWGLDGALVLGCRVKAADLSRHNECEGIN